MELKLGIVIMAIAGLVGFNRTFMELKQENGFKIEEVGHVLIAPLWN